MASKYVINDSVLSAYLAGKTTKEETGKVLKVMLGNPSLIMGLNMAAKAGFSTKIKAPKVLKGL